MQYRPGRPGDLPAFHKLLTVLESVDPATASRFEEALRSSARPIYVAHDAATGDLRGALVLDTAGTQAVRCALLLDPRETERDVITHLLDAAVSTATVRRGWQVAVPASDQRQQELWERHGFENSGEGIPVVEDDRILYLRPPAALPVVDEDRDFPTEADEPPPTDFEPVYAELPDLQLAMDELEGEARIDPETSSLRTEQISEVEDFIARAKRLKEERGPATYVSRHPEVELEVDDGSDPGEGGASSSLGFEFAFGEGTAPALDAQNESEEPEDSLELNDIPEAEPEVTPAQLRADFEDRLGERLTAYFGPDRLTEYLRLYHHAENFHRIRDANLQSLSIWINGRPPGAEAGRRKARAIGELVEYFIVEPAAALHEGLYPQRVLRYQGADWARTDLYRLILDYLDFDAESEEVYTDFITIPPKVLKRATGGYLKTGPNEHLYFICDQGLFGAGKQGFAMTDTAIYWKNVLQPAGVATYTTLRDVHREDDHLLIDGQYFDAGPRLNLRVALLLDKLRRLEPPK